MAKQNIPVLDQLRVVGQPESEYNISTWLARFHPTTAYDAATDDVAAARHSMLKWLGVKYRRFYGIDRVGDRLIDSAGTPVFEISENTSAMCIYNRRRNDGELSCTDCIGAIANGRACHEITSEDLKKIGNETHMIRWSMNAVEYAKRAQRDRWRFTVLRLFFWVFKRYL